MSRDVVLSERARTGSEYPAGAYAASHAGENGNEPELIKQLKEVGRDPLAQHSYLSLLPQQQAMTRRKHEVDAIIYMIETGIEYLGTKGRSADILERKIEGLKGLYPDYFKGSDGKHKETERKSDSYSARNCMNS